MTPNITPSRRTSSVNFFIWYKICYVSGKKGTRKITETETETFCTNIFKSVKHFLLLRVLFASFSPVQLLIYRSATDTQDKATSQSSVTPSPYSGHYLVSQSMNVYPKGRFTHSMPFPCRAHAVPLPCRAAKCLECVFPIWFTQCGRV